MFSVEQRDALCEHVLGLAKGDARVVAGAVVGSLAVGGGDRFSDVDLTFGVADDVAVASVLDDWAQMLGEELDAVHLVDLQRGPTTYRVLLFPGALQLDLSMTPANRFRPGGPRFRLLFGQMAPTDARAAAAPVSGIFISTPPFVSDLFGWGVIYALHARACIERGRVWQAEHYIGACRDHALSLACLGQGLPAVQARTYDDLSADTRARFDGAHVGSLEPDALRVALATSVDALIHVGTRARLPHVDTVARRLTDFR